MYHKNEKEKKTKNYTIKRETNEEIFFYKKQR